MKEVTGMCRFCGQQAMVCVPDDADIETITYEATLSCNCKLSEAFREGECVKEKLEMAKTSAQGTTFELFHDDYPEIEELLNGAMDGLCARKFKKITVNTHGKVKASISFSKGVINVEREDKAVVRRETEV